MGSPGHYPLPLKNHGEQSSQDDGPCSYVSVETSFRSAKPIPIARIGAKPTLHHYSIDLTKRMGLASFFHTASHPKEALSKAIASALGDYFEIDADKIEANLLSDTHIRLERLNLKEQRFRLPSDYVAIVTGTVSHVEFAWNWSLTSNTHENGSNVPKDAWIKDSNLRIEGPKFQVEIVAKCDHDGISSSTSNTAASSNYENTEIADAPGKEQQSGLQGFIWRQIQIVIDSLTLDLMDFDWTVVLPATNETKQQMILCFGGQQLQLKSLGRHAIQDLTESNLPPTNFHEALTQTLCISSIFANVTVSNDTATQGDQKLDLMEPFSYQIDISRAGERFGSYATGLRCQGCPPKDGQGLILHAGKTQLATLAHLGSLLVAPPSKAPIDKQASKEPGDKEEEKLDKTAESHGNDPSSSNDDKSLFFFQFSSMKLILLSDSFLAGYDAQFTYKADGSQMDISMEMMRYKASDSESEQTSAIQASQIRFSARPHQTITIKMIDSVHIPGLFSLDEPIQNTEIVYEGNALDIRLQSINASMLPADKTSEGSSAGKNGATTDQGYGSLIPISFPLRLAVDGSSVVHSTDGAPMHFQSLSVFLNPDTESNSTHIAVELKEFKNKLLHLTGAKVFAALPLFEPNEIQSLRVSTDSVKVTAGKSKQEWEATFTPKKELQPSQPKAVIHLPGAAVSSTKLTVSWKGTGVALKDTAIITREFRGNNATTSDDVLRFFTHTCLTRVPGFISNAEVFGVNVVEFTTSLGLSGLAGSGAGLAAVVAVDSVKGAFRAGKQQRGGDDGTGFRPDDLFRGILHASAGAASTAAQKRGKEKGNVLDFASGVTSATGNYVSHNKSRLGSAGAGGAGMIVGTMLGGPIGGLAAGVLASKLTKTTIENSESKSTDKDRSPHEDK